MDKRSPSFTYNDFIKGYQCVHWASSGTVQLMEAMAFYTVSKYQLHTIVRWFRPQRNHSVALSSQLSLSKTDFISWKASLQDIK